VRSSCRRLLRLAAAHLALPAGAVDSTEQVVGQADGDFERMLNNQNRYHNVTIGQRSDVFGIAASRASKTAAAPATSSCELPNLTN